MKRIKQKQNKDYVVTFIDHINKSSKFYCSKDMLEFHQRCLIGNPFIKSFNVSKFQSNKD